MGEEHHRANTKTFDHVEVFLILLNYIGISSIPQISIAITMFCLNQQIEMYLLKRRDLLRINLRRNESHHFLSDLKRDNTALAIS